MNDEYISVKICADGITAKELKPLDIKVLPPHEYMAIYNNPENHLRTFEIESIRYIDVTDQCGQCNVLDIPVGGQIVCNPIGAYRAEILENGKIRIL